MKREHSIKIKVCGMTQIEQVRQLERLGVDYAGFIFYERSARYAADKVDAVELKQLTGISKTGVFVNADYDVVLQTAEAYSLNAVQLHGDETPDFCKRVSSYIKTIKAFRLTGEEDLQSLIEDYENAVDYYLFDTRAETYGGTGKKFNWNILKQQVAVGKPYFLSGGVGPDDAPLINDFISESMNDLYAIDLNSKFETVPGVKDLSLLKIFLDEIKSGQDHHL